MVQLSATDESDIRGLSGISINASEITTEVNIKAYK